MLDSFSKAEKRQLRELASDAYEFEMSQAMEHLFDRFQLWADNELSAVDLNGEIHTHHNGIARDLYKQYVSNEPLFAVIIGIRRQAIADSSIKPALREKLQPLLAGIQDHSEEPE